MVALVAGYVWMNLPPGIPGVPADYPPATRPHRPGNLRQVGQRLRHSLMVDLDLINADMSPSQAGTRLRQAVNDQCPNHNRDLDEAVKRADEYLRDRPKQ